LIHKKGNTVKTVNSKDDTPIAFDQSGQGPALILVTGAFTTRADWSSLAASLAPHFSVFNYDRRGRGESGDTMPYAVEREIEDIDALITVAGGPAFLYAHSSGAALAMEAAIKLGDKVKKLAMYEAPYDDEPEAQRTWGAYIQQLTEALAAGRRGDAVALFMQYVGTPAEQIQAMRQTPAWPALEAIAPTLAYDHTYIIGKDRSVPVERAAQVRVPTLVMNGSASLPFMYETARMLSNAIPHAEHLTLEGQTHGPAIDVLVPVLTEFFLG
jgi:pimeloyl-ACP methyl ester carboxylesterase